ncbi:uncharacterized protein TNCV_4913501 [Trichonephila clavipes]|nr:uncharacterized protein TNCV_4913501 [Trichonephila clavipes]
MDVPLKKTSSGKRPKKISFENVSPNKSSSAKTLPSPHKISEAYENVCVEFQGYRLIDISLLFSQIEKLLCCSVCYGKIKMSEKSTVGLFSTFQFTCRKCSIEKKLNSCELVGIKNIPEINRRSVLVMRYISQGLSSLETFCFLMCLPNPVSQKAYDRINAKIADVSEALANASMKKAAAKEKIIDRTVNSVVVSGDGTWKTRGHTSLFGVCALIGADCGKVLDMEVVSSFCKGCDGDSKTFVSIAEKEPYGDSVPIVKIECVGHVQKQRGNRLRKLKALRGEKKLCDGKTIGGKDRLTDSIISKLTTFYGNAIRANSHNVNEMRQAVWAVWAHRSSTDDEPKHWFCPTGKNSWCKYNVSVHNNTVNEFSHKNTLPKAVSEVI